VLCTVYCVWSRGDVIWTVLSAVYCVYYVWSRGDVVWTVLCAVYCVLYVLCVV